MSNHKTKKLPRGVHKRGDSLIVVFALANGQIERRSVGPVSAETAQAERLEFRRQVRAGTYEKKQARQPVPPPEVPLTVADLWPLYLTNYVNEGGRDAGRQTIAWNNLKGTFGAMPVSAVSTQTITGYIAARRNAGRANGTVNRELAVLQAMFNLGTQSTKEGNKRLVEFVPAFPSKLAEAPPREGFITKEQYEALKANATTTWLRGFVECAYAFGNRKNELLTLLVGDLDLLYRWISIRGENEKTGKPRKLKMTTPVYNALCECVRGKEKTDFAFTRDDGTPVADPRKEWYAVAVASKLGIWVPAMGKKGEYQKYVGLGMHSFRRSAIRNMTRRGLSTAIAMKVSGHSTRSTFDRYDVVDEQDLEHAAQVIEHGGAVSRVESGTKTDTPKYEHQ